MRELTEFDRESMRSAEAKRARKHPPRSANFYVPPSEGGPQLYGLHEDKKTSYDPHSISSIKKRYRVHRKIARQIKHSGRV